MLIFPFFVSSCSILDIKLKPMSKFYFFLFFTFSYLTSFGQNLASISGVVRTDGMPTKGVEVLNPRTKAQVFTSADGGFKMEAKPNDTLFFVSKEHYNKFIKLNKSDFSKSVLTVDMIQKITELEEITIEKEKPYMPVTYGDMDEARLNMEQATIKNPFVYDGSIANGMDFVRMGKALAKLFTSKKKSTTDQKVDMTNYLKNNFDEEFYVKNLKLKKEEVDVFINTCVQDEKIIPVFRTKDPLQLIEFLYTKKEVFDTERSKYIALPDLPKY